MKKLYAIVLISVVMTAAKADDLAASFKQAAALAESQNKDRASQIYGAVDFNRYYEQKYGPVFVSCLKSTEHADTSPVSFVAAIGKDGDVLRLYVKHETNTFACARQTLQQGKFPAPPHFPYYMHISMKFSGN
jgi:hypothetical protein